MKRILSACVISALLAPVPGMAGQIALIGAVDFEWKTTEEGVAFAPLQGDRFKESYQAMVRLPGGITSPPHVKTANMYGVVLQGEMVHFAADGDPDQARRIGPGEFYSIPGGLARISACVSTEPCIAYLYQDGPFDFLPIQQ